MATSTQDLIEGFDPTGINSMSNAQILQLVRNARVADAMGLIITTVDDNAGNPDVPNAAGTTKLQRYMWRRVSATSVIFYGWVPTVANNVSGAGMLKWVSITLASIPDGAVTNSKLGALAVTDSKIYSVGWDKVTGVPAIILGTDQITLGDMLGSTYANMVLKANAVTDGKLASDATDNTKRAVSVLHIKSGTSKYSLRTNTAGNAVEWFLNYFSQLVTDFALGTKFQVACVNAAANALRWVNMPYVQSFADDDGTYGSNATAFVFDDNLPTSNKGVLYKAYNITPLTADGYLHIDVTVPITKAGAAGNVVIALYDKNNALYAGGTSTAFAVGVVTIDTIDYMRTINIKAKVSIAALTLVAGVASIALHYGPTANTAYVNGNSGGRKFGGALKVAVRIQETLT